MRDPAPDQARPGQLLGSVHLDPASIDPVLLASSGGKDSVVLIAEMVAKADAAGFPRERMTVLHNDLGRVAWPGTAALARRQADRYGLRFVERHRHQGDLLDQVEARGRWPGPRTLYCRSDHKRAPSLKFVTEIVRNLALDRRARILYCLGHRRQESPTRRKLLPLSLDERASNGRRELWRYYPLLEWTTDQIWAYIDDHGLEYHPVYDQGIPRLSCTFCVLASRRDLIRAAQLRPDLAAEYADVETRTGHRFRADVSMAQIIDAVSRATRAARSGPSEAEGIAGPAASFQKGGTMPCRTDPTTSMRHSAPGWLWQRSHR